MNRSLYRAVVNIVRHTDTPWEYVSSHAVAFSTSPKRAVSLAKDKAQAVIKRHPLYLDSSHSLTEVMLFQGQRKVCHIFITRELG